MRSFLDYQSRTPLTLPFFGLWYVVWGGLRAQDNLHAAARDQRFATDFVIVQEGVRHRGKGTRRTDYHCWDKPVIAPGGGRVLAAVDNVRDNAPNRMNGRRPLGNHVILDHGNGEYSFLAHLREGSLNVQVGQRIDAGAPLGNCGNSGNSSEPHLHYHLQNSATFGDGDGLPARFSNYFANGRRVRDGIPRCGQFVRGASSVELPDTVGDGE